MSSAEEKAEVLRTALISSLTGDTEGIDALFTEDVSVWSPAMVLSSRAELIDELSERSGAFSDFDAAVEIDIVGDRGYAEWVVSVTHSGPFEIDDELVIEPTGQRFELRGATVVDFDGDRISRLHQYWDEIALFEGLGLLPDD